MARITIELDDGRRIEYRVGNLRWTSGAPTREFTAAEYAELPEDRGFVHRKVTGPVALVLRAEVTP